MNAAKVAEWAGKLMDVLTGLRALAAQQGMPPEEFNKLAKEECERLSKFDDELDAIGRGEG